MTAPIENVLSLQLKQNLPGYGIYKCEILPQRS